MGWLGTFSKLLSRPWGTLTRALASNAPKGRFSVLPVSGFKKPCARQRVRISRVTTLRGLCPASRRFCGISCLPRPLPVLQDITLHFAGWLLRAGCLCPQLWTGVCRWSGAHWLPSNQQSFRSGDLGGAMSPNSFSSFTFLLRSGQ